jgi:hypothetical protein
VIEWAVFIYTIAVYENEGGDIMAPSGEEEDVD